MKSTNRRLVGLALAVGSCAVLADGPARAQSAVPAFAEVCSAYVNSGDVVLPVSVKGGPEATVVVDVPVPAGAVAICGWKLGAFPRDRDSRWSANVDLRVNGETIDHFRPRESSQQEPHFLPGGLGVSPAGGVQLVGRLFNEDTVPVKVRVNVRVWFAMAGPEKTRLPAGN